MAGYTQRKEDRDVPLKGIGYVAGKRDAIAQEENESWQRSLQMANMAAKMDPYTSLGFSLGQLLFSNAGKWFGGRNSDGTKHDSAAGAAGTTAPQGGKYDFFQYKTSDPLQMLANAGDTHAQFVLDNEQNQPSLMQPGQFGTDDYAKQNGISLQQNTFNPATQEATSTTLSTNDPTVLSGGPYFSMDTAGQNQGSLNTTFNPQQFNIENSLANLGSWQNMEKANGAGFLGSLLGGGLDDDWKKRNLIGG